jgi:hypothetical protein
MDENYRNVVIKHLILALVLTVFGLVLFGTIFRNYYQNIFPILLFIALIVNLLIFKLAFKKNKVNQSFFLLVSSFALKFFTYLLITILYFVRESEMLYRVTYIFVLFIIFISFSSLEVKMLTKFFKTNSGNE